MPASCTVASHLTACSNPELAGPRVQLSLDVQALCAVLHALDATQSCANYDAILAAAGELACQSPGRLQQIAASIQQSALALNPEALNCYTPQQVEAIRAYLWCMITSVI